MSADSNSPKEGGKEDIHKLHDKRKYNQNTRPLSPENRYNTMVAEHAIGVETTTGHENAQHMVNSA